MNYKSVELQLLESLVKLQDIVTLLDENSPLLCEIEANKNLIKTKYYRIAVMGEFKRGKSSLINALLGNEILPADVEPTTATINRITYGNSMKAFADFKDNTHKEIPIEELSDYVTKLTPEGAYIASTIKEVVVQTPTVICQNHVDIIDTPGLNDDAEMTKITIEMLENIDAVIITIHAKSPFSETERKFICELIKNENISNIIFVVSFMDVLDEDEYDYDKFIGFIKNRIKESVFNEFDESSEYFSRCHELLDDVNIYGVSSRQALKSFTSNDSKLLRKSRFDVFSKELLQIATAKQMQNAINNTVKNISRIMKNIEHIHQSKQKYFEDEIAKFKMLGESFDEIINDTISGNSMKDSLILKEFINNLNELNATLTQIRVSKNTVMQAFIKALSEIKECTNQNIKTALLDTARNQKNELDYIYNLTIMPRLTKLFININSIFKTTYANKLNILLEQAELCGRMNFSLIDEEELNYIFFTVNFNWAQSIIPDVADLTQYNIIEHVIECIESSYKKMEEIIIDLVDDLKKKMMISEKNNIENIVCAITNGKEYCETKQLQCENSIRANELNYKKYTQILQTILEDTAKFKPLQV